MSKVLQYSIKLAGSLYQVFNTYFWYCTANREKKKKMDFPDSPASGTDLHLAYRRSVTVKLLHLVAGTVFCCCFYLLWFVNFSQRYFPLSSPSKLPHNYQPLTPQPPPFPLHTTRFSDFANTHRLNANKDNQCKKEISTQGYGIWDVLFFLSLFFVRNVKWIKNSQQWCCKGQ